MPWSKIPQAINALRYYLLPKEQEVLEYDPFHLKILSNRQYVQFGEKFYVESLLKDRQLMRRLSHNDMTLETFRYVLSQVPAVRTVEFAGRGEPLLNREIFAMLRHVQESNNAYTSLTTSGLLLDRFSALILESPLNQIVIRLYGHKPSVYHAMSGLDARNFPVALDNLKQLVALRNRKATPLEIVVTMQVDVHHYGDVPDMVEFARKLGVDALWVENYLAPDGESASERSLFADYEPVKALYAETMAAFAKQSKADGRGMNLKLPVLLERDMSGNRHCHDPYTLLALDGDCNVMPCSRQLIHDVPDALAKQFAHDVPDPEKVGKIWDGDFWNNPMYQWMRQVHTPGNTEFEVPNPCRFCPKNVQS